VTVLHADSISKARGTRRILTAATLKVDAGTVVGVLGRMGEGKSTLLKICAGIEAPDSGWVLFAGAQSSRARFSDAAKRGLYYLADSWNLVSALTVRQHLEIVERRFSTATARWAVEILRIEHLLDAAVGALSGGEIRRAELAVAATRAPKCLLADEPFRGVDPLSAELLGATLRALVDRGAAIVVTGHEITSMVPYLDQIIWVTAGTTYPLGTPAQAWRHERFQRDYLGPRAASDLPSKASRIERAHTGS
jgi:ABC-type multidrug transport system ATPase subunit